MSPGPLEIGLVVLVILLVFGAKRLPALGRAVGDGMREFKDGIRGDKNAPPAELDNPEDPEAPDGDSASRS